MIRASVKLHFVLYHFEDYLQIVNIDVEHPLSLGFFSERVLESFHQNFKHFYKRYVGVKEKLLRSTIKYNALHINCVIDANNTRPNGVVN